MKDFSLPGIRNNEQMAKNAFNISVITAILFSLIILATFISNFENKIPIDLISILTLGLGIVMSVASAILSRREKSSLGIILVIVTIMLIVASRVFVQKGLAIPNGIVQIILVSSIAAYALPSKWVVRVAITAFIVALFTVVVDQFTVGIPASANPQTANLISLATGSIYLLILGTQFQNFSLRTKLVIGFLFLTIMPLAILGLQTFTTSKEIVQEQVKTRLTENSNSISSSLQTFMQVQLDIMDTESKLPEIVDYLTQGQLQLGIASVPAERALKTLKVLSQKDPDNIKSYTLVSTQGTSILSSDPTQVGVLYVDEEFYNYLITENKIFVSKVFFPLARPREPIFYLAAPIFSETDGRMTGIMLVTYRAKILQPIISAAANDRATASEYTFLLDDTYFINLGHSSRPDLLYKSFLEMDSSNLLDLQLHGVMNDGSVDSLIVSQPELIEQLKNMGEAAYFQMPALEYDGEIAEVAAVRVPNTNWIVVVGQPSSAINILTQNQTRTIVVSSILISMVSAIIALIVSNIFTSPIIQLTHVAETIAAGDLTKKAIFKQKDEIGVLAGTFNNMTDQIQELVANLEKRVDQRTAELQGATKQSEKRAQELQTIAEIARYISTEKDLATLLSLVTRVVSERFGFYHVGIFMLNENRDFAVLRAANSPGGQKMLERQHKLEVGQVGIVGNVTFTGNPRIALDTGADIVYFNNPDLPETRSEIALPLTARGTIMGALDAQSTVPNAFTDSDVSILSLLADQIAIAIDNVRLLDETQNALNESQSLFSQYLADAWQKKTASSIFGYHQSIAGGKPITNSEFEQTQNTDAPDESTISMPIRVRDQIIGIMNIRASTEGKIWDQDEISVVEAVAERIGLALDNARLFEETSSRASRERLVSDITTKIRGTNDPQEMIKTAVEELKRALGATHVEVVSNTNALPPDN